MTLIKLNEMKEELSAMVEILKDEIDTTEISIDSLEDDIIKEKALFYSDVTDNQRILLNSSIYKMELDLDAFKKYNNLVKKQLNDVISEIEHVNNSIKENRMEEIYNEFNEVDEEMLNYELFKNYPKELQQRYEKLLNEILEYEAQQLLDIILK